MAYTSTNFPSKKALKTALAEGKLVTVFSPGPFPVKSAGWVALEGPHYPKPHTWYAEGFLENGVLVKVK